MKHVLLLSSLSLLPVASIEAAIDNVPTPSVELVDSIIAAKPIQRKEPKYPMQAARNGNEGWVKMSFVIDKEGNVVDPVIEDSSGIRGFEKETLRAIKKWKYSPAMRDGQAIEQCQNSVQMDFKLHKGEAGARRKFVRQYKEASAALEGGDIPLAKDLVKKMDEDKIWNSYEDTWFWVLKADLDKVLKNERGQLQSLNRALSSKHRSEYLGNEMHLYLLRQKFALEVTHSLFTDALSTFALIRQLPDNEEVVKALETYALEVKDVIVAQPYIKVGAEIQTSGSWWHRLSRSRFTFTDIDGELDTVELRCANKREIYTIAPDSVWNIPQSWGRCSMMVVGDPQATFSLVELKQDA